MKDVPKPNKPERVLNTFVYFPDAKNKTTVHEIVVQASSVFDAVRKAVVRVQRKIWFDDTLLVQVKNEAGEWRVRPQRATARKHNTLRL